MLRYVGRVQRWMHGTEQLDNRFRTSMNVGWSPELEDRLQGDLRRADDDSLLRVLAGKPPIPVVRLVLAELWWRRPYNSGYAARDLRDRALREYLFLGQFLECDGGRSPDRAAEYAAALFDCVVRPCARREHDALLDVTIKELWTRKGEPGRKVVNRILATPGTSGLSEETWRWLMTSGVGTDGAAAEPSAPGGTHQPGRNGPGGPGGQGGRSGRSGRAARAADPASQAGPADHRSHPPGRRNSADRSRPGPPQSPPWPEPGRERPPAPTARTLLLGVVALAVLICGVLVLK